MKILLIFLFLVTVFLRFWQIVDYPVSLSLDESIICYDAYSLLNTGRDYHGNFLPLAFESIGDYKPPVLFYLIIPALSIFGLNEFGCRATVAGFSVLGVIVIYFLIKELLYKSSLPDKQREIVAVITTASMAVSPWHLKYSRAGFEAIVALVFLNLGLLLWLRFVRNKSKYLWLSGIFFVLSAYTYHAERLFAPFLVLGLIIIFKKNLKQNLQSFVVFIVVAIIISLPLMKIILNPQTNKRMAVTFVGKDFEIHQKLIRATEQNSSLKDYLFNHPNLLLLNFWFKRYLGYWDLSYLFTSGADLTVRDHPDIGLLYLVEIVPFLIGIILIIRKREIIENKRLNLLLLWVLIGALPASLANNAQHSLRSLTLIPLPQMMVGIGGVYIWGWIKKKRQWIKKIYLLAIVSGIGFSLLYYVNIYYHNSPIDQSEFWQYGMKQASVYAHAHEKEYKEIIFDPKFGSEGPYSVGIPFAYVLFYSQRDPAEFLKDPRRGLNRKSINHANYTFRDIYWPDDRNSKGKLFIGSPWVLPIKDLKREQILKKIYFKNGKLGFLVVKSI